MWSECQWNMRQVKDTQISRTSRHLSSLLQTMRRVGIFGLAEHEVLFEWLFDSISRHDEFPS